MDSTLIKPNNSFFAKNQIIYNYSSIDSQNYSNDIVQIIFNLVCCEKSFTGRKVELTQIEETINTNQIVIICGLGGIGKTELARQFAWQYKTKHRANVVWINAEVTDTISKQFSKLAIEFGIKYEERDENKIIEDIYKKLNKRKSLIIFDNVFSKNDIKSFILQNSYENVKVLITSQNIEWGDGKLIRLETLSLNEAIEFLQNQLKCDKTMEDMKKLAVDLQYLPLALQQAVGYINDTNMYDSPYSLTTYIKDFIHKKLLLKYPDYCDNLYEKTIYSTISLTVEHISYVNKNATKILHACCYLDKDRISEFHLDNILDNKTKLKSAINILLKYSLLNKRTNEMKNKYPELIYNIHRLVQLYYRQIKLPDIDGCQEILKQLLHSSGKYYDLLNNYYWNDLSAIKISDYNSFFDDCPRKNELMYYLGYNQCNEIIKKTTGLFDDEHYYQGLRGATTKGSLQTVQCLYSLIEGKFSSDDSKELLKIAVGNNSIDIIKFMYENGNNIDEDYICYVASCGHVSLMKYLTNIGIDIKETEALHEAIYNENNIEMLKYLTEIAYDLNKKRSYDGNTVLHIAAQNDCIAIVKYLIELGKGKCNINIQNDDGETPAFLACRKRNKNIFRYLVENNCDFLTIKNNAGFTLLHFVVYLDWEYGINILINNDNYTYNFTNGDFTPLHLAVSEDHFSIAERIFKKIQPNYSTVNNVNDVAFAELVTNKWYSIAKYLAYNYYSSATLWVAASRGWISIVEYLLRERNIDVNAFPNVCGYNNYSALHLAAKFEHTSVIEVLLKNNSDVNLQNNRGNTPLHVATENGCIKSVLLLISKRCDINLQNNKNETPLHLAVSQENKELVSLLVRNGCDKNIENRWGETPLMIAENRELEEIIGILGRKIV